MNGIKIFIEIGHESSLKAKPTPDGFTHDWELFVRSCHSNDISHFIDKVVFNLHESFAKPKRAIKEPPYIVKESGYAGFEVIIDIYVKNREEPKKISFQYDMDLQNSGPSIYRTQTFSHTFSNPNEDFRRKLLKGGGVAVCNTSLVNNFDEKSRDRSTSSSSVPTAAAAAQGAMNSVGNGDLGKAASGTAPSAATNTNSGKHKSREQPVNSEFANLFGTPITKTTAPVTGSSTASLKVSPDPKAHRKTSPNRAATTTNSGSSAKGSSSAASAGGGGKGEKNSTSANASSSSSSKEKGFASNSSSSRSRHTSDSPHVDRGEKYERREGEKGGRERNRSRERESTKGGSNSTSNNGSTKERSQKRRPSSPKYSSPMGGNSSNPGSKARSPSRGGSSEYQSSSKGGASSVAASGKSAAAAVEGAVSTSSNSSSSKKSSKKEKKDKSHDKERGATSNNHNSSTTPAADQQQSKKERENSGKREGGSGGGTSKASKETGSKYSTGKETSGNNNSNHSSRAEEKAPQSGTGTKKDEKVRREGDRDSSSATGSSPLDSLKKHKHKKKDKEKGGGTSGGAGKGGGSTKDAADGKVQSPATTSQSAVGVKGAVTPPSQAKEKKQRDRGVKDGFASNSPAAGQGKSALSSSEKSQDAFGNFSHNSKTSNHSNLSDSEENEQLAEPLPAEEAVSKSSGAPVGKTKRSEKGEKRKRKGKEDQSDDGEGEKRNKRKLKDDLSDGQMHSPNKMEPPLKLPRKQQPPADDGYLNKNGTESSLENNNYQGSNNLRATESDAYIQELKVLHHKIMTLQDNNDLQQVVEIIAVTGMYEITDATKTFDFDLCVLNVETVQRLKDFFLMRTK